MNNLERERDFYRQQSDELGARVIRLQGEQTRAWREAQRSRTTASLLHAVYRLADSDVSDDQIGQRFLRVLLDTLIVDRVALFEYVPEIGRFVTQHTLGFPETVQPGFTPLDPPEPFTFANSKTEPDPLLVCLRQAAGVPYLLWAFHTRSGLALLAGNASEDQHLRRPFEAGDREILEGALNVFAELVERQQAQRQRDAVLAALRESEERYRTILDSVEEGYFEVDLTGNFTFFNESMRRMLGYSADEMMGMNYRQYMDGETAQKVYRAFNRVFRTGEPTRVLDWLLLRKDDTQRDIEVSVSLIRDAQGEPSGFRGIARDVTERVEAEAEKEAMLAALRESEARYRQLVQHAPSGIFEIDLSKARFTSVNEVMCEYTGYSREEFLALSPFDILTEDSRQRFMERQQKSLAGEPVPDTVEYQVVGKNGREFWVLLNTRFVYEDGIPTRATVVVYDISERKQAEEQLRNSEERLKILFEYAPDAYYLSDLKGTFIDGNRAAAEAVGYKKSELIGENFLKLNLLAARDIPRAATLLARNVLGKATGPDEFVLNRKDGGQVHLEISTYPVKIDGQTLVLGMARDISERLQAKRQLEERRQYLERVLAAVPDAIVTLDPDHQIVEWNPGAERMFGYTRAEAVGRDLDDLVNQPDTLEEAAAFTQTLMNQRNVPPVETVRYQKDGSPLHVIVAGAPILVEGELTGAVAIYTDITERVWAEAEKELHRTALRKAHDELETRVEERTTELSTLLEAARVTSSTLDLGQVLLTLANQLLGVSGFHSCVVYEWDRGANQVHALAEHARSVHPHGGGETYRLADYPTSQRVLTSGQPEIVQAGTDDPESGWMDEVGIGTLLMLPLRAGEETIGLVEIGSSQADFVFDDATVSRCQQIVEKAADWLKPSLPDTPGPDLLALVARLVEASGTPMCTISSWCRSQEELHTAVEYLDLTWPRGTGPAYRLADWPSSARALEKGLATVARRSDPDADAIDRGDLVKWGARTLAILPLAIKGEPIGLVELYDVAEERDVGDQELRLWQGVSDQAAIAMENARLYERAQREIAERVRAEENMRQRAGELSTMLEVSRAISSTLDLEAVLEIIAQQMAKVTGVAGCTISRWDKEADAVVTWVEWRQKSAEEADLPGTTYALDDFPATRTVMESGQPLTVRVSDPEADPAEVAHMRQVDTASLLILPLAAGERIIGVVELDEDEHERIFTASEIGLCQALAAQAAVAIENARLHAETQRRLQQQIALREAGAVISSSLELPDVLSHIAEQMAQAIDATSGYICSLDRQTRSSTVMAEYVGPQASKQEQVSDLGVTYEEIDDRFLEPMLDGRFWIDQVDDPDLPERDRRDMEDFGGQSILYVPLFVRGQTIGYAELWESRRRRAFAAEEIAICQDIAWNAAVAVENARLYEQAQREIAERARAEQRIQASLEEKEVLLQEIHHRVKNNLQIISSLLSLQSGLVDDQQALEIFQDSQHRVRSMALIHEKLYRSQNLARIDFADYIRDLTRYLFASYVTIDQDVNLNVQADDVHLGIDTAVPCGLILNELVSNALKHAFPAQGNGRDGRETPPTGEIRVELCWEKENTLMMIVADNGVGLPGDLDVRYSTSLGLQLVTTLVDQLDGTLELDDRGGTLFKITFPAQL